MKKAVKFILILNVTLAMLALSIASGSAAGTPGKVNYVAFGDSVSAGVRGGAGFEIRSDKGYTDNIAGMLKGIGILGGFNKDFCISGETAKGLAQKTAVLKDPSSASAAFVKNADFITLDIGANDLLYPLFTYATRNITDFEVDGIRQAINKIIDELYNGSIGTDVQKNIETILQNMLTANGSAHIYVMGYYNPLPTVSAFLDIDLNEPTKYFNMLIRKAISDVKIKYPQAAIFYVSTFDAMAAAADNLVATNIHPTEAGYSVITKEFWKQIKTMEAISRAYATISVSQFTLNSASVPLYAYIINNNNYIKLRDFAMVLNGTEKQIGISWDGIANVVTITTGEIYMPVGGELAPLGGNGIIRAKLGDSSLVMDGEVLNLTVYTINANNYIKLRDLAAAFDIGVTWDGGSNTVNLDLHKRYEPSEA